MWSRSFVTPDHFAPLQHYPRIQLVSRPSISQMCFRFPVSRRLFSSVSLLLLPLPIILAIGCGTSQPEVEYQFGGRGSLKIGDEAPPITVSNWYQDQPITKMERGTVYVIEFWATWCGPCKISMPQMSNLQAKYASEAIFVGVTDESPEQVEVFLAGESRPGSTWSDEIQYRLATDREQSMSRNYMAAANQMNIPTAFIVGKTGKIEWMGHPAMIEKPLAKATAAVTTPPAK